MPRIPIYPEVKISLKKKKKRHANLENVQSNDSTEALRAQNSKRAGTKRKDAFDVINAKKKDVKRRRQTANYQRYTVSIPFASFYRETPKKANSLEKIKAISGFIKKVILEAQLFVNYFILKHPNKLTNDIFEQNFW
ncbi:hypothetical protein AB4K20DRAFT_1888734 [Rhizopus microsporus]